MKKNYYIRWSSVEVSDLQAWRWSDYWQSDNLLQFVKSYKKEKFSFDHKNWNLSSLSHKHEEFSPYIAHGLRKKRRHGMQREKRNVM